MDFYMYLTTADLNVPRKLERLNGSDWQCALVELSLQVDDQDRLYITSNILEETMVNGIGRPILRHVETKGKKSIHQKYQDRYYIDCRNDFQNLNPWRFEYVDTDFKNVDFSAIHMVLHFKKKCDNERHEM